MPRTDRIRGSSPNNSTATPTAYRCAAPATGSPLCRAMPSRSRRSGARSLRIGRDAGGLRLAICARQREQRRSRGQGLRLRRRRDRCDRLPHPAGNCSRASTIFSIGRTRISGYSAPTISAGRATRSMPISPDQRRFARRARRSVHGSGFNTGSTAARRAVKLCRVCIPTTARIARTSFPSPPAAGISRAGPDRRHVSGSSRCPGVAPRSRFVLPHRQSPTAAPPCPG